MDNNFLKEALTVCLLIYKFIKLRKQRTRRWAIRPANRDRSTGVYFVKVYKTIKAIDPELFFAHTRMDPKLYNLLFAMLKDRLKTKRGRISAEERLAVTISYLAHGVSMHYLASSYKLGRSTVRKIIVEVTELIWKTLAPIYVSEPTGAQYEDIANDFYNTWNIPNCCGAIDGKHFPIKCPNKSGSKYFNYKKFFSIILMATCDAKYTFTNVSIGSYGSESDGGVFKSSIFGKKLCEEKIPLPPSKPLSNANNTNFPHFFVGDAAFPLRKNLMRPYPGQNLDITKKIFNYRLSRARRVIENSFGILTARWRVLRNTMKWSPENAERIVLACMALHNFIILNDTSRWYCYETYVDWELNNHSIHEGEWRTETQNDAETTSLQALQHRPTTMAFCLREQLANYFMHEGAVDFQLGMIN